TLFASLQSKIHQLLIVGNNSIFVRDMELTDLCSRSVLACFEEFTKVTLKSLKSQESFYSPEGEVILEGIVEREFRVIFELLRAMALATGGECFRKSRTSFLSKISKADTHTDLPLTHARFFFPWNPPDLTNSLTMLQPLISHGFQIFVKDQPL